MLGAEVEQVNGRGVGDKSITLIAMTIGAESRADQEDLIRRMAAV
jgi:hypothetical protein